MILTREREKYADAWDLPAYAHESPGERYAMDFQKITGIDNTYDVSEPPWDERT